MVFPKQVFPQRSFPKNIFPNRFLSKKLDLGWPKLLRKVLADLIPIFQEKFIRKNFVLPILRKNCL